MADLPICFLVTGELSREDRLFNKKDVRSVFDALSRFGGGARSEG
jgi:hypothetical protein